MRPGLLRRPLLLGPATAVLLAAAPCTAAAPGDPWEGMNRRFFAVEGFLDRALIGPVAHTYVRLPKPIRTALGNFSRNLGEPIVAVNDILQGRIGTAASTVGRFAINSTFGIAGLRDPATKGRIPHHDNDFGITLGRWGAGPGPYLFLPLVGPSSVRDGFGSAADIGLNPLTYADYDGRFAVGVTTTVVDGLDRRLDAEQNLRTIFATSVDPYATLRSYYLQNRQAEITGQAEVGPLPEFDVTAPPSQTPPEGSTSPQPAQEVPPLPPMPDAAPAPDAGAPTPDTSAGPGPTQPPRGSACLAPA